MLDHTLREPGKNPSVDFPWAWFGLDTNATYLVQELQNSLWEVYLNAAHIL